uniref:Uncharacterized protein n=1 Tax=viral metagenome TaxID=1070528 RepID=A0A6C0AD34_9ZZZZ
MDPLESLLTKPSVSAEINVYFPVEYFSENSGNLNLTKDSFDNFIPKCLEKFGKYDKTSEIYYCKNEKVYKTINKKNVHIFKLDTTETLNLKTFIVVRSEYIKITNEEFPKLEYYDDIRKQNKMIFNAGIGRLILITQSHTDAECSYFVELSFDPLKKMTNEDKTQFKSLIDFVVSHIS